VLKRKQQEPKGKSGQKQKRMWVEVESEFESDGSGENGWRVQGLHDIAFCLVELQSNLEGKNQFLREQNGFLQRVAMCMERSRFGLEPEEDSTMRE